MSSRLIGVFALLKVVDVLDRGGVLLASMWFIVATLLLLRGRQWSLTLIPVAAVTYGAGLTNQHLWLFMMAGVLLALDDLELVQAAMRWQITILYGFASLAKFTDAYLSGDNLARVASQSPIGSHLASFPGWPALALVGLLTEAFLAVGLWLAPRVAVPIGVAFHVGLIAVVATDLTHAFRLSVFGGLVLAFYPAFMDRSSVPNVLETAETTR